MPVHQWFLFDLGNVMIRLDYERMLAGICAESHANRDTLVKKLEMMGGVRDLERGATTFRDFYDFLVEKVQYRGTIQSLRDAWCSMLVAPVEGIEELIERVRRQYRVGFLSNTNETHVEEIFRRFGVLFDEDDRFVFSHRAGCAKPDPLIYQLAIRQLGALPSQIVFIDDLAENVFAALDQGILAYRFRGALATARTLERDGLLEREDHGLLELLADA